MPDHPAALRAAALLAFLAAPRAGATVATGLSSFDGVEETLVRYFPAERRFVPDGFVNIVDEGGGVFRMRLRHASDQWDGDRDTRNRDRQRAEVKGLGPHQKDGETFEYATTWRTDPLFHGSKRFCHLFQLKSTDGDSGSPLITMSIEQRPGQASVRYWSGGQKSSIAAREFRYVPGAWETVRIRVRTSRKSDGEVLVSVDGDPFQGVHGVAVFRPDASDYRPKWGLYRGVGPGTDLGDDFVEHKDVRADRLGGAAVDNGDLERAARERARLSPAAAIAWLQAQPPSPGRDFALASLAADWEGSDPSAAMAWAEAEAPPGAREDAETRVYTRWAERDPAAATAWLRARAPRPSLDGLLWLQATDTTLRYVSRPAALACAGLISDPGLRFRAYEEVVLIWARDPAEGPNASRYVENEARLDPIQRSDLAAELARRRVGRPGRSDD